MKAVEVREEAMRVEGRDKGGRAVEEEIRRREAQSGRRDGEIGEMAER